MKFLNKSIYALALAGMIGLWSCTSDEILPGGDTALKGHPVSVTLTVSRGEAQTRTQLSENTTNGGLNDVWETGDQLLVYNAQGLKAGVLTIDSGEGTDTGIFTGSVTAENGTHDFCLWYTDPEYTGTDSKSEKPIYFTTGTEGDNRLTVDLNFAPKMTSAKALSAMDVLSKKVTLSVKDNKGYQVQDETLTAHLAMARFSLTGIPTGTMGTLTINKVNDPNPGRIYKKAAFSLSSGETASTITEGTGIVIKDVNAGDIYVAFVPGTYTLSFNFEAAGQTYTYEFKQPTTLKGGVYYNTFDESNSTISGIEIPLVKVGGEPIKGNPADMGSWGGGGQNLPPTAKAIGPYFHSHTGGWVNNYNSTQKSGGWCYANENFNGIQDGLVTSKYSSSSDNHKFFQWGRYLGYPEGIGTYTLYYPNQPQIDIVGYLGENGAGTPVEFDCLGMGTSDFTMQKVNDWSLIYGLVDLNRNQALDYSLPNSNVDWYSRSGNPCPDNYRLPTVEELELLVPSNEGFSGNTYAEIKPYNGKKYAFKWTVVRNATIPYIEVKSIETTLSSVTANNAIFNDAKSIKLYANGILRAHNASVLNKKKEGFYWSSESGSNIGGLVGSTSGYGGKGLDIYIDSNAVEIMIGVYPRSYAANILPIYDPTSKGGSIMPIYPYAYLNVENLPRLP